MYTWTVYPASSKAPMVACGATDNEHVAYKSVEGILALSEDFILGEVNQDGQNHMQCRRARNGGFVWYDPFLRVPERVSDGAGGGS